MSLFDCLALALAVLCGLAAGAPRISPRHVFDRDINLATLNLRPAGIDDNQFHTVQFQYLKEGGYLPIIDAMPVFLYAGTKEGGAACYPESGVDVNDPSKPNPGTDHAKFVKPGENCRDPRADGKYEGLFTLGDSFPVYVSASYCSDKLDEWRVDYSLYYVHDGILSTGHRHDWEGISVVWKRSIPGQEWWHRDSAIYRVHGRHDHIGWGDLETVDVDTGANSDVKKFDLRYKKHPKVYVGYNSHASFPHPARREFDPKKDLIANLQDDEFRFPNYWRMPRLEDVHDYSEINKNWNYGSATSTPPVIKEAICGY